MSKPVTIDEVEAAYRRVIRSYQRYENGHHGQGYDILRVAYEDACAQEGVDLARALKAAGELGRKDLVAHCRQATEAEDDEVRFWAAWSAALLGVEPRVEDDITALLVSN